MTCDPKTLINIHNRDLHRGQKVHPSSPISAELIYHPYPSTQMAYSLTKISSLKADAIICVAVVIKHAPTVLHLKGVDGGFSCWCRCTIKSNPATFQWHCRAIFFAIPAGVLQHVPQRVFLSTREPRNISFHRRRNPEGSVGFL